MDGAVAGRACEVVVSGGAVQYFRFGTDIEQCVYVTDVQHSAIGEFKTINLGSSPATPSVPVFESDRIAAGRDRGDQVVAFAGKADAVLIDAFLKEDTP